MDNHFQKFITGLQHIGIPTNDLEATIAFYDTLGFQVAFRTVNEAANEKVAFLRMGDVTIETYENKQAALANGALDHIALNVTDIEAVFEAAKEKGFCILDTEIQFLPFWENGVKFLRLWDLIGRRLNLVSIYKEGYNGTEKYGYKSAIDQQDCIWHG